jgi:hypothetical protein
MTDKQETNHAFARSRSNVWLDTGSDADLRVLAERIKHAAKCGRGARISASEALLLLSYNLPSTVEDKCVGEPETDET